MLTETYRSDNLEIIYVEMRCLRADVTKLWLKIEFHAVETKSAATILAVTLSCMIPVKRWRPVPRRDPWTEYCTHERTFEEKRAAQHFVVDNLRKKITMEARFIIFKDKRRLGTVVHCNAKWL